MLGKYNLSETEYEIMRVLWDNPKVFTTKDLLDVCNENGEKEWKRQTLNTFLSRLELKDAVKRSRSKVWAAGDEAYYVRLQTKEILDMTYDGKLTNFIVALNGGKELKKADEEKLNQVIDKIFNSEA
ncbi:BlaI/MecI/CopY family transcriptional regulator [Lachnospiraceae bacterium OttesenSCG-928-D06]|nr:BlaI/MecI/CopY family transcriptional regulator [Lachnospiraceae bacterium OttesenSCG-928-D06]